MRSGGNSAPILAVAGGSAAQLRVPTTKPGAGQRYKTRGRISEEVLSALLARAAQWCPRSWPMIKRLAPGSRRPAAPPEPSIAPRQDWPRSPNANAARQIAAAPNSITASSASPGSSWASRPPRETSVPTEMPVENRTDLNQIAVPAWIRYRDYSRRASRATPVPRAKVNLTPFIVRARRAAPMRCTTTSVPIACSSGCDPWRCPSPSSCPGAWTPRPPSR